MKTILLIDDEEDFCFFVKSNLEASHEFEILRAINGPDGLRLAREQRPDLILLDLHMPGMSGDEVAEELKQSAGTAAIPIVFLTALVTNAETGHENFERIGCRYFIGKPVATDVLLKSIRYSGGKNEKQIDVLPNDDAFGLSPAVSQPGCPWVCLRPG